MRSTSKGPRPRFNVPTVAAVAVLALFSPWASAEEVISADAKAHFEAGVNLLQDPDGARYEEAYREFTAAYASSPSWKILGNLGIAGMKLERDGEAIIAFEKYLKEGGAQIDADERAQFERDLVTLKSGVVRVKLDAAGGSVLDERFTAAGAVVQNTYGAEQLAQPLGLRAGRHRFTARAAGKAPVVWEIELGPKQELEHAFVFSSPPAGATPPPSEKSGVNGLRVASYAALGVGVVGVGLGTVFALKSKSDFAAGNDLCPAFPCSLSMAQAAAREQHGRDGDSAKTLSIVGFVVGGVGLAAGVTLLVLSSSKKSPAEAAKIESFIGLGSAGVRGSF